MTEKCPRRTAAHLPVNDCLVFWEAEDPGPGVSFLRFWGYTAYFNKTKAHLVKAIHRFPILVKSCGDSHWISEFMAKDSHFLGRRKESHRQRKPFWCSLKHGSQNRLPVKPQVPGPIPGLRNHSLCVCVGGGAEGAEWNSEGINLYQCSPADSDASQSSRTITLYHHQGDKRVPTMG